MSEVKEIVGNCGGRKFVDVMIEITVGDIDWKKIVTGGDRSMGSKNEMRSQRCQVDLARVVELLI